MFSTDTLLMHRRHSYRSCELGEMFTESHLIMKELMMYTRRRELLCCLKEVNLGRKCTQGLKLGRTLKDRERDSIGWVGADWLLCF